MKTTILDGYLGPAQAARVLGVTPQYIGKLVRLGRLEAVVTPLGRLILKESVERLKAEREANQE